MPRLPLQAALIAITLPLAFASTLHAQGPGPAPQQMGTYTFPAGQPPGAFGTVYGGPYQQGMISATQQPGGFYPQGYPVMRAAHYPNLNASLYPCPQPNVPPQIGGTQITNSALYPHEMLYPHRYRALYPPFYYKVKWRYGSSAIGAGPLNLFGLLPWPGPAFYRTRVSQKVELKGTEVDVKYHGGISPFTLFIPPS